MRALLAIALIGGLAATAGADVSPEDTAKAAALFDSGQKLVEAKKIDEACDAFSQSLAIDPQLGTKLNLADCREKQGRFADAYRLFDEAASEAARTAKSGREKFARQHLDGLRGKLVRYTLQVAASDTPGLAVTVGGRAVPPASWTTEQVAESGTLVIDATAPGRTPFHTEVDGAAGGQLTVQVPALEPAKTIVVAPTPTPTPTTTSSRSKLPWIVGGAGGALLVGSVALGLHARSRYNTERDMPGADLNDRLDGPQREADIATVLAIAGGVAVTVGVVLYVRGKKQDTVAVAPVASPSSVGVAITWTH